MKKIRKVLAAAACMALLLGSASVFAAEEFPAKSNNPTWGDVWAVLDYVSALVDSGEYEYYSDSDEMENMVKHLSEGQKLVSAEKEDERLRIAGGYYWGHESEYGDVSDVTLLTGDAAAHYDECYSACKAVIDSFRTATGECYYEDLRPTLDALETQIAVLRSKVDNGEIEIIADDAEVPEGGEWIRESAIQAFDAIYDDYDSLLSDPDLTRNQFQALIDRFTNALNDAKAGGSFTLETSTTITQNPTGSSVTPSEVSGIADAAAIVEAYATTSSVSGVKSTVDGVYIVKKVNGIAFTTPSADIAAGYGMAPGERAFVKVWDLIPAKGYLAQTVIDNTAAALGAETGPVLNIEAGKMDANGKYSLLSQDGSEITVKVGIPAYFAQDGKIFAVVRVRSGGTFSILKDLDADPNTVTFTTTGGAGAYAIVKY